MEIDEQMENKVLVVDHPGCGGSGYPVAEEGIVTGKSQGQTEPESKRADVLEWSVLVEISEAKWIKRQTLHRFLDAHRIEYRSRPLPKHLVRYFVRTRDLCCAQSVLEALECVTPAQTTGPTPATVSKEETDDADS